MHPPADHHSLAHLVRSADADLSATGVDGAILRISDLAPASESFTWFPLDGAHPLEVLLGFVAPPHWRALGVSCGGRAQRLGTDGRAWRDAAGVRSRPDPVRVTVLIDRTGDATGVMRRADEVTPLPGRPEGAVADACRRALGLPTAPPPPSTLELWTAAWLDRVVDMAGRVDGPVRLRSWSAVAALHAAAGGPDRGQGAPLDPAALATSARALADAWPWSRLRAEPTVADVPGPPPPVQLARWMDDGMWARWLLARLPSTDDLLAAIHALLPPVLADAVDLVAGAAGHGSRDADS